MAGIVASTLRRKAFHKKLPVDNRYQIVETHISQSPESHGSPSSPGFKARIGAARAPKGSKLCHEDFWPACTSPDVMTIAFATFETFDTLIPKANAWLQENLDIYLIKCETVEKKVTKVEEVTTDNCMFIPKNHHAGYIKGLRLWYVHVSGARKMALESMAPAEIGYMNVIPKCLDSSGKYPEYENLPETYAAINAYLAEVPLEGKIVTIETVPLKLSRKQWKGLEINPDQTFFPDEFVRHVLNITRIYFRYGDPEAELIGAQDFLPDFEGPSGWKSLYQSSPRYGSFSTAMQKVKEWIQRTSHIAVTNVQTLEVVYRKHPGSIHTGLNFSEKVESCTMIRFIRVTYVRPSNSDFSDISAFYSPPPSISYKTFLPAPIKVGMCRGSPVYENLGSTIERAKMWLRCIERRIIGVETFYHPLNCIWHKQDGCEGTVLKGEWTTSGRSDRQHKKRRKLVHVIRVFLDGDFIEPPAYLLPPSPMVEEVNDCTCSLM